jgi:uncharacterized protein involved in response to NO
LFIGGRVTPSFTGSWIARMGAGDRPASHGAADAVVMALSFIAIALWVAAPEGAATGGLATMAGAANLWRLSRWRGFTAQQDRLVLVLHVGFLFAALGFGAVAAHALSPSFVPYGASVTSGLFALSAS